MSEADATALAAEPDVDVVTQDQLIAGPGYEPPSARSRSARPAALTGGDASIHQVAFTPARAAQPQITPAALQNTAPWGLDRIDQHALPLDEKYAYDDLAGQGVTVFVLGTGVSINHSDFGGRAVWGEDFVDDDFNQHDDCVGTGTAEAGQVAGAQVGVAKKATVVALRVYGCNSIGAFSWEAAAFQWAIDHKTGPAVILFNIDVCVDLKTGEEQPCNPDDIQSNITSQENAFHHGILVVAGAGDRNENTCGGRVGVAPDDFYVGASTRADARASFSNFGSCLSMFAPGADIISDWPGGGTLNVGGSTAYAAAYVAGAAALFLGKPEFAGAAPAAVRDELIGNRTTVDKLAGIGTGSPNRLLFTGPPGFFTIGDSIGLAARPDGRLQLVGVNSQGSMFWRAQSQPGSAGWDGWTQSADPGWFSIGTGTNADGRIAMAGLTKSGLIYVRSQNAPHIQNPPATPGWFNWRQADGLLASVTFEHNNSGRLEMFGTNVQGQAFYRSQTSPGSRFWGQWLPFAVPVKVSSIAAATTADHRIEVFMVDEAGQVWHSVQGSANDNNWGPFAKLTGFAIATVAAARNGNGRLELIGLDNGGNPWRRAEVTAGSDVWEDWAPLPAVTLSHLAVAANPSDGRIQIDAVNNLGQIWQSAQQQTDSGLYTPWAQVDGLLRP